MFAIHDGQTLTDARKVYEQAIIEYEPIIDKVADLFMQMNTQHAEVAATTHFAAQEVNARPEGKPNDKEVLDTVIKWKQKRRPSLDEKEVALTVRNRNMFSLIGAKVCTDLPIIEVDILRV